MKIDTVSGNTIELNDAVFAVELNETLIHQVVVAYLSSGRSGDKGQKTRSEVSGGGKKPWRQKGTGRARAGTIRSPIWVGGGRAFATRPGERNFKKKVNRKSYKKAMSSIVSELLRQERVIVVDSFGLDIVSTKALKVKLGELGLDSGLLISDTVDENLYLSSRNIPRVNAVEADVVDPVSLVNSQQIVITASALERLEKRLAG